VAKDLLKRIREGGPLRSAEMEGRAGKGWWDLGVMKRVAAALWSSGELAIRERRGFQRTYDLTERVIPEALRRRPLSAPDALEVLLRRFLGLPVASGRRWGVARPASGGTQRGARQTGGHTSEGARLGANERTARRVPCRPPPRGMGLAQGVTDRPLCQRLRGRSLHPPLDRCGDAPRSWSGGERAP